MTPTYAVGGLTEADIDLIVMALDRYTSDDKSINTTYACDLMLKFDDITDPVENDFEDDTVATVAPVSVKLEGNVYHVAFKR